MTETYQDECPGCGAMMVYHQYGYGFHGICGRCGFEMNE
tara:strand:- start:150 stop:266 length:117 start_codon:yes stop_codon:yes gene_type:complete